MAIQKYMAKISGPLLDRIDFHIEVPAGKYKELSSRNVESSERIRERVLRAREIQVRRFNGRKGLFSNADMESKDIRVYCRLDAAGGRGIENGDHKTRPFGKSVRPYT